jgi:hypothetical protein
MKPSSLLIGLLVFVAACGRASDDAPGGVRSAAPTAPGVTSDAATSGWPNEPGGLVPFSDQRWDRIVRPEVSGQGGVARLAARARALLSSAPDRHDGWSYLRRSSSRDDEIVPEAGAPFSPPDVLRIVFTPGMRRDSEPSVHWIGLPGVKEIYAAWWMKLSPNWMPSPAGAGKITFLWPPNGQGLAYSNIGGSAAPHHVNVATTWPPYGYRFWEPNVAATSVGYDEWHSVEWHVMWESRPGAADGIVRWWVDGALNGDYRDMRFPACCLQQFEFAPTLQNPPPVEQYMYIDHTYVSTK